MSGEYMSKLWWPRKKAGSWWEEQQVRWFIQLPSLATFYLLSQFEKNE